MSDELSNALDAGRTLGLTAFNVVVDDASGRPAAELESFQMFSGFLPRVGERIALPDERRVEVIRVLYRAGSLPGKQWMTIVANVVVKIVESAPA